MGKSDVFRKLMSTEPRRSQTKPNELELRPLHFKCSCGNLKHSTHGAVKRSSSASLSSSDGSESEDEESDEQDGRGYNITNLIKLLIIHETKGEQQRSGAILRNLATSVTIDKDVTEVQLHQVNIYVLPYFLRKSNFAGVSLLFSLYVAPPP